MRVKTERLQKELAVLRQEAERDSALAHGASLDDGAGDAADATGAGVAENRIGFSLAPNSVLNIRAQFRAAGGPQMLGAWSGGGGGNSGGGNTDGPWRERRAIETVMGVIDVYEAFNKVR